MNLPGRESRTVPLDTLCGEPLGLERFLRVATAAASALADLHRRDLAHYDIRPQNLEVDLDSGEVRIADLGLASSPSLEPRALAYMSPEKTGRMNRPVDYRTDLYSLGIVFYQLLTGRLPFEASDPLEWVHCHIARMPRPPAEVTPEVPPTVSDLVMKLLAKVADDRYQSASGLQFDLEQCLARWQSTRRIAPFALGARDVSDHLQIPHRLYGREAEVATLLAAFDRMAASGRPEMVLVSGYSGIGKSSLVHELHKPIVPARGNFISGKFDQYKRNIPYATITQAFRELIQQILAGTEAEVARWKRDLERALGNNGQVIVDVIPQVELILGPQPAVPELPSAEAQNRFRIVFQQFIGVFTRKEHPLALFLDDLQWADSASLRLVKDLVTHEEMGYLLVVGAYRDNEVSPTHPLILTLDEARKEGAVVSDILLGPLSLGHLTAFVGDTLRCRPDEAFPLADLVYRKTAGNPFFAIQFLTALYEERLIELDGSRGTWRWDVGKIRAKGFTENVVDLMVGKLKRLPADTQEVLKRVACVGNSADTATLAMVLGRPEEELHAILWESVRTGILRRAGDTYRFLHDRLQEAAYSLVPEERRAALHLQIGRLLVSHLTEAALEERVFDVANQLNRGTFLITDPREKETLRRLNFLAGRKARTAIAYGSAKSYLDQAAALLPPDAWTASYEDTFTLYLELSECEYVLGSFPRAEELQDLILEHARSNPDRARVYTLRIRLYQSSGRSEDGVAVAFDALRLFGVTFPETADEIREAFAAEHRAVAVNLRGRRIADLVDAPLAADADVRAIIGLVDESFAGMYNARPQLFPLFVVTAVNVSLRHGNAAESCYAYICYSIILAGVLGDIPSAFEFSEMSLRLNEKFGDTRLKGRLLYVHACFVNHWRRHIATSRKVMEQSFVASLDVGDLVYACYSRTEAAWQDVERGAPLHEIIEMAREGAAFCRQNHNDAIYEATRLKAQFAASLQGSTADPMSFDGNDFAEAECVAVFNRVSYRTGIAFLHALKQIAAFTYGRHAEALACAARVEPLLPAIVARPLVATHHFYHALTLTALYPQASAEEQAQYARVIEAKLQKLKLWADNCPENYLNRYALVSAEVARIQGRDSDAERLYEQAIRSAHENGFVHNEALANELASRFYRARGFDRIADLYLRDARAGYVRWGARGKVRELDARYPQLEEQSSTTHTRALGSGPEQLDVLAIVKASQAISGQIVLDQLLDTLMRIVLQSAGAQKGWLLLLRPRGRAAIAKDKDEELSLACEASMHEGGGRMRLDLQAGIPGPLLPEAILKYVQRSLEKVILADAAQPNPFSADAYLAREGPKSVLCLPIVRQRELIGLLYLENNLVTGAFTPDRLAVLELLASQAAISLDNARLYTDLEQENAERRRAEEKYRSIFENSVEGIFQSTPDGRFLTANPALARMLGFDSPEDLIAHTRDIARELYVDPARRQEFRQTLEAQGQVLGFVAEARRRDGGTIWTSLSARAVRDATGKLLYYEGTAEDVTEGKRSEEAAAALRAALEKAAVEWARTFDSMEAPILILDAAGRIVRLNRQARQLTGSSYEGVVGRPVADIGHGEPWQSAGEAAVRVRQTRLATHCQVRDVVDGKTWDIAAVPSPGPSGEEERVIVVARDVSQTVQLQESLRRSETMSAMGMLVAGVAHEVRNPLFGISANLDAFEAQVGVRSELQPFTAMMRGEVERLAALMQGLLDYGKPIQSAPSPCPMDAVVAEAVEWSAGLADRSHVTLVNGVVPGLLPVSMDRKRMVQVFQNLLQNAIQHSPAGGTVTVTASQEDGEDGASLVLTVEDSGSGFSQENLPRIFEPFFSERRGGTGLGLAIVRRIVEEHGGTVRAANRPQGGGEVVVRLPCAGA